MNRLWQKILLFQKIDQVLFHFLTIGLVGGGAAWVRAQYWRRAFGRNRFFHLFLFAMVSLLLTLMTNATGSSRYSLIMIVPAMIFLIYLLRMLWLLPGKRLRWLPALLVCLILAIHIGKLCRGFNQQRDAQIKAAALAISKAERQADHAIVFDTTKWLSVLVYQGNLKSATWYGDEGKLVPNLKEALPLHDLFFLCVSPAEAGRILPQIAGQYPQLNWEKLYDSGYLEVYRAKNPNPAFGRKISATSPPGGKTVMSEGFERWRSFQVETDPNLKTLRERGVTFLNGPEVFLPEAWYLNPGHGYIAGKSGDLEITVDEKKPLAGQRSLIIRNGTLNGMVNARFYPASDYEARFLFRGKRRSRITFDLYQYGIGRKFLGISTAATFYCLNDDEVREGVFEFSVPPRNAKEFAFSFSVSGTMELDNLQLMEKNIGGAQ